MESLKPNAFLVRLSGTREGWPKDMSADEFEVIQSHIEYMKDLLVHDKLVLSGPVLEPFYSVVILKTESRDEANSIMSKDPSVVASLQTFKLEPMRVDIPDIN